MEDMELERPPAPPRWDGRRVLFAMRHEGGELACAISSDALRELTSRRCFTPRELLDTFASARPRIEAIARGKLRGRAGPPPMPLTVWLDDVEDHLAASAPSGGSGR